MGVFNMRLHIVFTILLTLVVTTSNADIYKCENAEGQLEFSQIPCGNDSSQTEILNYEESEAVKSGREENLRQAEADRLQKRYVELNDELSSLKATQQYIRDKGGLGSSANYAAYGTMIRRVQTEIERIKAQAKEKNISLSYELF